MQKHRNYGLDVLRIILALMVISIHINANGTGRVLMHSYGSDWSVLINAVCNLSFPAVNCYVLISGFFSYKNDKKMEKVMMGLVKLWLAVLFFSVLGYIGSSVYLGNKLEMVELFQRFFPILRGKWWYMTVYFVLMLLSPYINRMCSNLNKKEHFLLCVIAVICCSIVPMFKSWNDVISVNYGYSIIWFITLYVIGAFISKYLVITENDTKRRFVFLGLIVGYLLITFLSITIANMGQRAGYLWMLYPYNSIFTLGQAICLVIGFMHLKLETKIGFVVSKIASISMASYLLHCQEDIESILWEKLTLWQYAQSPRIVVWYLGVLSAIFICGICIEFVRLNINRLIKIDDMLSKIERKYLVKEKVNE